MEVLGTGVAVCFIPNEATSKLEVALLMSIQSLPSGSFTVTGQLKSGIAGAATNVSPSPSCLTHVLAMASWSSMAFSYRPARAPVHPIHIDITVFLGLPVKYQIQVQYAFSQVRNLSIFFA